ncbi:MAG: hypothetical protein WA317_01475 [Mycobacterium sp.]|uniref:hypothetical protein n=1 Tax=Mycobacterium sp. TaxID=1785 RepID=UPI003CC561D2
MEYEITELDVCTVCIHLIANGEFNDGTDAADVARAGWETTFGDQAQYLTYGGEELGFSWSSCDACGNGDGGDRYRASLMVPADRVNGATVTRVS